MLIRLWKLGRPPKYDISIMVMLECNIHPINNIRIMMLSNGNLAGLKLLAPPRKPEMPHKMDLASKEILQVTNSRAIRESNGIQRCNQPKAA